MSKDKVLIGDAVIQALCMVHQKALRDGAEDIATILAEAIENVIELDGVSSLNGVSEDLLKQFFILNGFKNLDDKQREQFLKRIENSGDNVVFGYF